MEEGREEKGWVDRGVRGDEEMEEGPMAESLEDLAADLVGHMPDSPVPGAAAASWGAPASRWETRGHTLAVPVRIRRISKHWCRGKSWWRCCSCRKSERDGWAEDSNLNWQGDLMWGRHM